MDNLLKGKTFEKWQPIDWILLFCVGVGIVIFSTSLFRGILESRSVKVEYLASDLAQNDKKIWVDITGGVERPGVYEMNDGERVKDALVVAGGLSDKADRNLITNRINLAEKLKDGQKLVIPILSDTPGVQGYAEAKIAGKLININTSSVSELDTLWGIGEATAKKIIDSRPFANVEELLSRKIINSKTFERIKNEVSVY